MSAVTTSLPLAANILYSIWEGAQRAGVRPTTVFLLGPPGVGKTSIARDLAARMAEYERKTLASISDKENPEEHQLWKQRVEAGPCKVLLDLTSQQPEDLMGLPTVQGGQTKFMPQKWHLEAGVQGRAGVLILDDLPAATASVQTAARQIALEGEVHEHKISNRVLIVVTGNRRDDKTGATTLPAHFLNSVLVLSITPDRESWAAWYAKHANGDPVVPAFLEFKSAHFSRLPKEGDTNGSFATPRTWTKLGAMLQQVGTANLSTLAAGLVGEGVAVEFSAFHKMQNQMIPPLTLLGNPKGVLPQPENILNSADKMIATVYGIATATVTKVRGKANTRKAVWDFMVALCWISGDTGEYTSMGVNVIRSYGEGTDIMKLLRELTIEITTSEEAAAKYPDGKMMATRLRKIIPLLT